MSLDELVSQALDAACASVIPVSTVALSPTSTQAGPAPANALALDVDVDLPAQPFGQSAGALAVVGFCGERLRGSLCLSANDLGLRRIAERFGVDPGDDGSVDDAIAELARLVVQELRRELLVDGVAIASTSPLVVRGSAVEARRRVGGRSFERDASRGADVVRVMLDLEVGASFVPGHTPVGEGVVPEIDAQLF